MTAQSQTRAQIRAQFPTLTDDVRSDGDALVHTAGRIGAIVRISTGSPDLHTPKDMEHLLELLREEIGLMETQAESAKQRIDHVAFLADDTPHKKAVRSAVERFVQS